MLKKDITFENFDGQQETKTFYFNLSIPELLDLQESVEGGLHGSLELIAKSEDQAAMAKTFGAIIDKAYCQRTADGIDKDPVELRRFKNSDAYSVLFMEIITNAGTATEFINGVMPAKLTEKVRELVKSGKLELPEMAAAPPKPKKVDDYTMTELTNLPYEEFDRLVRAASPGSLSKDVLVLAMQRRP